MAREITQQQAEEAQSLASETAEYGLGVTVSAEVKYPADWLNKPADYNSLAAGMRELGMSAEAARLEDHLVDLHQLAEEFNQRVAALGKERDRQLRADAMRFAKKAKKTWRLVSRRLRPTPAPPHWAVRCSPKGRPPVNGTEGPVGAP